MNHKDALIAEQLINNNAEAATETLKEKCSRLYAQNAESPQQFLSDLQKTNQFIAKIATNKKVDNYNFRNSKASFLLLLSKNEAFLIFTAKYNANDKVERNEKSHS